MKFFFTPDKREKIVSNTTGMTMQGNLDTYTGIDFAGTRVNTGATYKVLSNTGETVGYWVGPDTPESAFALTNAVETGGSVQRVLGFDIRKLLKGTPVAITSQQAMDALRKELLARAKQLACTEGVRPKEIGLSASIQASIGIIVGGSGTLAVDLKWDTAELCK